MICFLIRNLIILLPIYLIETFSADEDTWCYDALITIAVPALATTFA